MQDSLSGVDGTGKLGLTENFESSADDSYSHPAAGAGGFGGARTSDVGSQSQGQGYTTNANTGGGSDDSSFGGAGGYGGTGGDLRGSSDLTNSGIPSGGNDGAAPSYDSNPSSGKGFSSGRDAEGGQQGSHQGPAEVISTYGGSKPSTGGDNFGSSTGSDASYGGAGAAAATGGALAGGAAYESSRDRNNQSLSGSSDNYGSNSSGNIGQEGVGNVTGVPQVDNFANDKLKERTDEDGFTDLTGGQDNAPSGLTGRVKLDANEPTIETTKQRSERDEKGRELDSYGRHYDL